MCEIKDRLALLGKSQVWLLLELRKRGINTNPPQLSNIIHGLYTYPKATAVLNECLVIIEEAESYANCTTVSG
jgi:hypothetical protein